MTKIILNLLLSLTLVSCTKINYQEDVYPEFLKKHPKAEISQSFPIGGYDLESITAQKTDLVIMFSENGIDLQEIWTATRAGGWSVVFKCKSERNTCLKEK